MGIESNDIDFTIDNMKGDEFVQLLIKYLNNT